QHVPVDRVPAEGAFLHGRASPQCAAEARKPRASGERANDLEEEPHVEQMRGEHEGEVSARVHAERVVAESEHRVADHVEMARHGLEQEGGKGFVHNAVELKEIIEIEVIMNQREVHHGREGEWYNRGNDHGCWWR